LLQIIRFSILFCLVAMSPAWGQSRYDIIEDFESEQPTFVSYPGQDNDPDDWQINTSNPYGGTGSSLRLYGDTWKNQTIMPVSVTDTTVWQIAVYGDNLGDRQAFGLSDGSNELFYTFFGRDLPADNNWYTVYQGAYPLDQWRLYLLPIGRDWQNQFGYQPNLNQLTYVNDATSSTPGVTLFDAIADVTDDLPRAPYVRILYTVETQEKVSDKLQRLSIQFQGEVFDPDSEEHSWAWDFGDSTTSKLSNPSHEFLVEADHPFTVGLVVTDPQGLAAGDTCQVAVSPGSPAGPLTVNFVGDIFTGRGYENYGGIIDTYGIESLYTPTLGIFGNAADVNVANLEVPYTSRGTRHPTKSVVFRSQPENITGISYAGVDLVTLGNNHIVDYGEIGMLDTMAGLDDLNIRYSGAGSNEYMALLPTFWTEKGVRMGFLGLCNRTGRQWNYQPFLDAGYDKPGFAYLLPQNLASSINYTRPLSDIVIVQTHSGDEYETAPPPGAMAGGLPASDPVIEAAGIFADGPEFKFRNEPTPGERELRRQAIDFGADILINHHPHVLQGFESYAGKLIAHSLGNFIFDLYYPETMPTLVLTLEIEKTGITGYRFTPAWINHWIPEPVTGNLRREIIDRLADYSRPMNALVVPLMDSNEARIHLSRAHVDSTVHNTNVTVPLIEVDGFTTSAPIELAGRGNLSTIEKITASSPCEVRYGREILWHGGFEDEGADLWDDNTDDEVIVSDNSHNGLYSLRLRRLSSASGQTGTDLEKNLPCDPSKEHSASAWISTENASQARTMLRFYDSRYSTSPIYDVDLATRINGSTGWTHQWRDLETPASATYFDMRCGHEPSATDTGFSWYDDLALIEWDNWSDAGSDLKIPSPNNYRYLQVRTTSGSMNEVTLGYFETVYGTSDISATTPDNPSWAGFELACFPNPFNPRITIDLDLSKGTQMSSLSEVVIEVFDVRGRKVRTLQQGLLSTGKRHGMTWDGLDDKGHGLPSGIYLVQAKVGEQFARQKITLLR
jgi:poly-gamma-glutamate capsule biosynthesis protein CapA/YwtB (metallophosphatase superfamily)